MTSAADKQHQKRSRGFPGAAVVKNPPANAGDITEAGREDPLEEGMATQSSVLAWRIPMDRRYLAGRLQSMRSQSRT